MKHRINPDVIRKHAKVPRTFREATGKHCYFPEDPGEPPLWVWLVVMLFAAYVIFLLW